MSRKKRKRKGKRQGHFCWVCGRRRANETFSGGGHARHVCPDCAKLGSAELDYRQALRDLQCCATVAGIIPRKRRKSFEPFLQHHDPRIRSHAEEMLEEDRLARALMRAMPQYDDQGATAFPKLQQ